MSDAAERHLRRYRSLAWQWDNLLRIPGTPIRLGWDALLGVIPVLGDAAGGMLGSYGIWVSWRQGAPLSVLLRMLLNVLIDTVIGAIPVLGDLFDVGWRSNSRNVSRYPATVWGLACIWLPRRSVKKCWTSAGSEDDVVIARLPRQ